MRLIKVLMLTIGMVSFVWTSGMGQVVRYLKWTDNANFEYGTHVLDDSGNAYIVSYPTDFDTLAAHCQINPTYQIICTKINRWGTLIWQKLVGWSGNPECALLYKNHALHLPIYTYLGMQSCGSNDSDGFADTWANDVVKINPYTGETKRKSAPPKENCGLNNNVYSYYCKDSINLIFAKETGPQKYDYYVRKFNFDGASVSDTPIDNISARRTNSIGAFNFDRDANSLLVADMTGLHVFDSNWNNTTNIVLRQFGVTGKLFHFKVAVNKTYYAINCAVYPDINSSGHYYCTLIFNNQGELISNRKTACFNDLLLTEDNRLLAIYTNAKGDAPTMNSSKNDPITFLDMDIYQRERRNYNLGYSGVWPRKLSLAMDGRIIISGQYYPDSKPQRPHETFYLSTPLDSIPTTPTPGLNCSRINVYPNPANLTLNVSLGFDVRSEIYVQIYDMLGKQQYSSVAASSVIKCDIARLPAATYVVKVSGTALNCALPFTKQ